MKRNIIKRIARQIKEAEKAISDIDPSLMEVIEHNNELDAVRLMDDLAKLVDCLEFVMNEDHKWSNRNLCQDHHPGKLVWRDPIGWGSYAPVCRCEVCERK